MPHAPQFKLLSERFTHAVPQADCPGRHPHTLLVQIWLDEHAMPQAPQFVLLVDVSTQLPLQTVPLHEALQIPSAQY
jgi:hypothetical protein